jgi:hypothetical protein
MRNSKSFSIIVFLAFLVFSYQNIFSQNNSDEFLKLVMQGDIKEVENYIEKGEIK